LSTIFINYRKQGEAYAAALLDERLSKRFGTSSVFRASRSIAAGEDYELAILRAVEQCRAMLVVVGPHWSAAFSEKRCEPRDDWVRREIVEALKQDKHVMPVLLSGVQRLSEEGIPPDVARLTRFQYLRFDYRNLDEDANRIAAELAAAVPELRRPPHPLESKRRGLTGFVADVRARFTAKS
jgi:hypothetical protein